jgi:hypothetical protein
LSGPKIGNLTLDRAEGTDVNRALITAGGMLEQRTAAQEVAIKTSPSTTQRLWPVFPPDMTSTGMP